MIKRFIEWLISDLSNYNKYSTHQQEEMKYVLTILIYELIKFILILTIFYFFGYFKECLLILIYMVITKPFTGGYHEDNQKKCFLSTLIIVMFIVILSKNSNLDIVSSIILNFISIFCIYNQVPIINPKMPLTKENLIKRNRIISIVNSLIFIILSIAMFNIKWFSQVIVWTGVVQTMLLFNKFKEIHGGKEYEV